MHMGQVECQGVIGGQAGGVTGSWARPGRSWGGWGVRGNGPGRGLQGGTWSQGHGGVRGQWAGRESWGHGAGRGLGGHRPDSRQGVVGHGVMGMGQAEGHGVMEQAGVQGVMGQAGAQGFSVYVRVCACCVGAWCVGWGCLGAVCALGALMAYNTAQVLRGPCSTYSGIADHPCMSDDDMMCVCVGGRSLLVGGMGGKWAFR